MLEFCLFGALDLRDRADRHRLRSVLGQPKRVALLAYIAASNPRGCVRRDQLLGLFWPELDAAHARSALNQSLYVLRQALGEDVLEARGADELCVNRQRLWCDVAAFRDALSIREFAGALEVYTGDLLTGFFLSDCPEFEQWVESERTQLRTQASGAAWQLAEEAEAKGNPLDAVHWARRACSLAPYDEIPHQRLLRLQQRIGDRAGRSEERR